MMSRCSREWVPRVWRSSAGVEVGEYVVSIALEGMVVQVRQVLRVCLWCVPSIDLGELGVPVRVGLCMSVDGVPGNRFKDSVLPV